MSAAAQGRKILWTIVLVAALTLVTAIGLLQPPAPEAQQEKSPRYARLLKLRQLARERADVRLAALNGTRAPASTKLAKPAGPAGEIDDRFAKTYALQEMRELKLPCAKAGDLRFEKAVAQIRFSGQACTKAAEIESTEIRNDTNGSSATVFLTSVNGFSTDYVSLAPGANRIRILHVFKRGGREEHEYNLERAL